MNKSQIFNNILRKKGGPKFSMWQEMSYNKPFMLYTTQKFRLRNEYEPDSRFDYIYEDIKFKTKKEESHESNEADTFVCDSDGCVV